MSFDTAIVAEGGGQRGIYTAGVLDAFLAQEFNPFSIACGVSAGAQNLLSYYLKEAGYAKKAILELTAADDFLVPYRWIASRNILDLDGYFERTVTDPDYKLPYQGINDIQRTNRLQFVATDKDTLEPVYLEPDDLSIVPALKASCAIPYLYSPGVVIGKRTLLDGAVADPLPVRHVYALGARRILLIRTVHKNNPANYALWRRRIERTKKLRVAPTSLLDMLESHEAAMTETWSFINNPPNDLDLVIMQPQQALRSRTLSSAEDALVTDYEQGKHDAEVALLELEKWSFFSNT